MAGLLIATWLDKRRRSRGAKPLEDDDLLLRQDLSLAIRLETLWDQGTTRLIWAMFWSALCGLAVALLAKVFALSLPMGLTFIFVALLAATALPGPIYAVGAYRAIKQARRLIAALD